eukprot:3690954-Prymnesium_polylepis.1
MRSLQTAPAVVPEASECRLSATHCVPTSDRHNSPGASRNGRSLTALSLLSLISHHHTQLIRPKACRTYKRSSERKKKSSWSSVAGSTGTEALLGSKRRASYAVHQSPHVRLGWQIMPMLYRLSHSVETPASGLSAACVSVRH